MDFCNNLRPFGKLTQMNFWFFSPSDDSQRKQYEEWLQETQQLLQMQQKYLEEQIGAHRKSKKALSAKQRTAKKAGREFPEEDAEQLKHVTEQQSMVQKQLEQVRDGCVSSQQLRRCLVCHSLRTQEFGQHYVACRSGLFAGLKRLHSSCLPSGDQALNFLEATKGIESHKPDLGEQ